MAKRKPGKANWCVQVRNSTHGMWVDWLCFTKKRDAIREVKDETRFASKIPARPMRIRPAPGSGRR
jgi:hypothetical protein